MSILRATYDPLAEFDRLFDNAFVTRFPMGQSDVSRVQRHPFKPKVDVHEDAQSNTVTATFELPGLKKEDVNIDLHNNRLTISGEINASSEREEHGYAVRERSFGAFSRTLHVPVGVDANEVKATMEHGVLTVTFPKSTPEQAPKKITVG